MSLPWWSKNDAQMYRALSLFPEELEGKFLGPDEFRGYFKGFHGRPVQDIVEALHYYGQKECFKHEIMLMPEYLKQGKALAQITADLSKLQSDPSSSPDEYHGLSEPVHAKVIAEQPLTKTEVSVLPDEAKRYLAFILSDIDRTRLREELAIYDDNTFIQPSRLVKSTHKEPSEYAAHVFMDGPERRVVCIIVTGSGDYPIAKLHADRAPYDFMHYLFRPENSNREVTIEEAQKKNTSCSGRTNLTELVDDCGFNKALKDIFFPIMNNDKVRFAPVARINRQQLEAIKKLSAKFVNKK
jgi:hypothetical protein